LAAFGFSWSFQIHTHSLGYFHPLAADTNMLIEQSSRVDLLKPAELAEKLGVSRTWLYDAAKAGRIPSIRIGGVQGPLRFVPEDVQRWLDAARAEWTPGRPSGTTRPNSLELSDIIGQPAARASPRRRR
jgi:excisionase family DNA binding protein